MVITKECEICGGQYDEVQGAVWHSVQCPNHPDAIDDTPEPAPVASNVSSFAQARALRSHPREHVAMEALNLAREWLETEGGDHVIVFIGRTNSDNSSGTKYFQTGSFSAHAQAGLIVEGMDLLRNSGRHD